MDPLGLKPALSEIYNNKLSNMWINSGMKDKIFVGTHETIACTGGVREARYRCTQSGRFDGVHLYGPSGIKTYTNSVMKILQKADLVSNDCSPCPQFQYQDRRSGVRQARPCNSWEQDRDIRHQNLRPSSGQTRFSSVTTRGQKQVTSRLSYSNYNRYDVLSDAPQGNF